MRRCTGGINPAGWLKRVVAALRDAAAIDTALTPLHNLLMKGICSWRMLPLQLRDYASRIEADPEQLKAVEDRLDLLVRLKRKYAPDIDAIIALGVALEAELEELRGRSRSGASWNRSWRPSAVCWTDLG